MEKVLYSIAIGFSSPFVIFCLQNMYAIIPQLVSTPLQCDFADSLKRLIFPPLALEWLCDLPLLIEHGTIDMCQCWLHLKRSLHFCKPSWNSSCYWKNADVSICHLGEQITTRNVSETTLGQPANVPAKGRYSNKPSHAQASRSSSKPSFVNKTKRLYSESH